MSFLYVPSVRYFCEGNDWSGGKRAGHWRDEAGRTRIERFLEVVYRNFTKKHDLRFNIIADIVNYKNSFLQLT
jgi:hypothetical protein